MAEPLTITRAYDSQLEAGDGRTILGRCVPYDVVTTVADPPDYQPYRESIRRGAFRNVLKSPHRVLLNYEHQETLGAQIGKAVELIDTDSGLDAVFRAYDDDDDADKALKLIRAGVCTGFSVQAIIAANGSRMRADGVIERTLVSQLRHVALTASPAYADALITATRSGGNLELPGPQIVQIRARQAELRLRFAR